MSPKPDHTLTAPRILLVEDDAALAAGLVQALRRMGFEADRAGDGEAALAAIDTRRYDLAVLDLGLPRLGGDEVVRRLRARALPLPLLILSAREGSDERVRLLNLGADDFLVKPAPLAELEARVRALLRRGRLPSSSEYRVGRLRIDPSGHCAWLGDTPLDLPQREWEALHHLASRAGRIVSREQMADAVYGVDEAVTPNAVEKIISRLRARIEGCGVEIRTVRGLGYSLKEEAGSGA